MQNTYLSNKNPTKIIDSSLNICKHLIEINTIKHATKKIIKISINFLTHHHDKCDG